MLTISAAAQRAMPGANPVPEDRRARPVAHVGSTSERICLSTPRPDQK